ncbi:hypothetical protein GCM10017790_26180 [Amycolatopsis oliviviridis]|uniref:Uncharacterized protein n=1 Tax=Amycolatopsis oliviviridis TaxID=1471590 RepID=A0ABQ3LJW8_9PSEU|nr:hypothetical protein GCM10017790_26180 [Amycolatopsis oliviviridis]
MRVKAPFTRLSRGNSPFAPQPKYMKGSFTEPGASKGAFMYRKQPQATLRRTRAAGQVAAATDQEIKSPDDCRLMVPKEKTGLAEEN